MLLNIHTSTEASWLIRDREIGVRGGTSEYFVCMLRPAKTEKNVSHHQNNDVKEVGTPPM